MILNIFIQRLYYLPRSKTLKNFCKKCCKLGVNPLPTAHSKLDTHQASAAASVHGPNAGILPFHDGSSLVRAVVLQPLVVYVRFLRQPLDSDHVTF